MDVVYLLDEGMGLHVGLPGSGVGWLWVLVHDDIIARKLGNVKWKSEKNVMRRGPLWGGIAGSASCLGWWGCATAGLAPVEQ